ncbi:hypothetical protein L211DRAFT_851050 [Terfezia boudieri ATCC MYA-4762]|uniref:Uncharacterized protein n=1 Tax=Terfezia boudieri ATCC MYA-4762 TaxID=1051890 RepID=A0A3N4LGQ5_9PEZI|nr:hypothetical protein L211DRAFT_851050 [Terfezia boudieri ATCC MYA-4762]
MSKPRGCKNFTHVQCDYNRCRGRDISAGHVKDCPFQDSDEEDQDEAEYSDVEDDENEWKPVRAVQHKPTPATAGVSTLGLNAQDTPPQAMKSHNPWVPKTSKVSPKTPNTAGIIGKPVSPSPSVLLKTWAKAPTPPPPSHYPPATQMTVPDRARRYGLSYHRKSVYNMEQGFKKKFVSI